MTEPHAARVSIIIKALNEEEHVTAAIESALAARPLVADVILADSGSTDRTVNIARDYPVTIVQLSDPALGTCGLGAQLGWPFAKAELVYLLDGDMVLLPGFLPAAVEALDGDPKLAGVGGQVVEKTATNAQFRRRQQRWRRPVTGPVPALEMGGLYRRAAIEELGYLTNANLHSFEELELGLRLQVAGWRLRRLEVPAIKHYGPDVRSRDLLRHHLSSRYLWGSGELLRASLGRPWMGRVAVRFFHLLAALGWWLWLLFGLLALPVSPIPLLAGLGLGAIFVGAAVLDSGWRDAPFRFLHWQAHTGAMIRGFFRTQRDPQEPVDYRVVQSGPTSDEA